MPLVKTSCLWLVAAALAAQQYPVLPVANSPRNIEHLLQDRQGRLWVSTHEDLLCFDGERFFSLRDAGFPPELGALAEDEEGAILSITGSGVYRFFNGHLEHFAAGLGIDDLVPYGPGLLIGKAPGSLYRLRRIGKEWRAETLSRSDTGMTITRDGAGNLLTTCPNGWCEFPAAMIAGGGTAKGPVFHPNSLATRAPPGAWTSSRVLRDRAGCLWFRATEWVAYQCPGQEQPTMLPATVAGRNVWDTAEETDDGEMIFASMASVSVGRPGSFQTISSADGLPEEAITSAIRGRDGTLWIGSIGGLFRFPYPFRMTVWKSPFGLFSAFQRWQGVLYAGTSAGIARLDGGRWTALRGAEQIGSVSSLAVGGNRLWAAAPGKAVVKIGPSGSIEASTPPGQTDVGEALVGTADGAIWSAGDEIYRVVEKGRELALVRDGPRDLPAADGRIAPDRKYGLWACFGGRLIFWQRGVSTTIANGLPQGRCRSIALTPGGDIWAGFQSVFTLIRPTPPFSGMSGKAAVRIYSGGGDTGNAVTFTLLADAQSRLWRGTQDGIYVAAAEQAERGLWLRLGETDGLSELSINRGSLYADDDGSVWWGAAASVVHFAAPPDLTAPVSAPRVFLSAFAVDGTAPKLAELSPELPSGRKLTAYLGSLDFERRNSLRVRYRLLPNEKRWRESTNLALDLGSPGWGRRTLEVQSRFSAGEWSQSWRREFTLLRPWWLSWPAILGVVGFLGGAALGGAGWIRRSRLRARTRLPDLTAWRTAFLASEESLVGVTLDHRFRVDEPLARGGFAAVFKGVDLRTGRPCAIKVFRRDVLEESWMAHRFEQEVSALEQIRHPAVVSIHGHGSTREGSLYLAMELIEGGTLRELLNAGPLTAKRAGSLLRQAAGALESIHQRGIFHRDLKPENLMLRAGRAPEEDLVLIDFSIAIVQAPDQTLHGLSRAAGTLYYMAPEQAMGFATPASDIFSLTKVLLEMLTGRRLPDLLPDAKLDLPERVRELARALPIRLSEESVTLIGAALEFDPSRRPQDAAEFARPIVRDLMSGKENPLTNPGLASKGDAPGAR